jgi:hypothetical protein
MIAQSFRCKTRIPASTGLTLAETPAKPDTMTAQSFWIQNVAVERPGFIQQRNDRYSSPRGVFGMIPQSLT